MLYAGVFALFVNGWIHGGVVSSTAFGDRVECEKYIPAMRSALFTKYGVYIVIEQGCKTHEKWIEIIGTDPFPGRDI